MPGPPSQHLLFGRNRKPGGATAATRRPTPLPKTTPALAALALALLAAALLSLAHTHAEAAAFRAAATPGTLAARPAAVRVLDGDTLDVARVRVRLLHFDAPEGEQRCVGRKAWLFGVRSYSWRCGDAATAALQRLVSAASWVECVPRGRDVYGRTLAVCAAVGSRTSPAWWWEARSPWHARSSGASFFLLPPPGSVPLSTWMVDRGWAVSFRAPKASGLAGREAAAKAAKVGVWIDAAFVKPEVWRRKERESVKKEAGAARNPARLGANRS